MKRICFILLCLGLLWICGLVFFTYRINHFPIDKESKTDAIVVLTGGRHRLVEAIKLFNDGMSDKLFISGVQKNISLKDLERKNAIKVSDGDRITLDKVATNTFENARETSLWIKQQNIKSIRLVTSNYHILRSVVEFRRWNKNVSIILHPVYSEKVSALWWKSVDSFWFLAEEYNKFLVAYVRALVYHV